jgi:hypothetical protein
MIRVSSNEVSHIGKHGNIFMIFSNFIIRDLNRIVHVSHFYEDCINLIGKGNLKKKNQVLTSRENTRTDWIKPNLSKLGLKTHWIDFRWDLVCFGKILCDKYFHTINS